MTGQEILILAAIFTIISVSIRVTENIIDGIIAKQNKKNGKIPGTNPINFYELKADTEKAARVLEHFDDVSNRISGIYEILKHCDTDGTPLCYTPRSLIKLQERTLEKLDIIISLLAKQNSK